MFHSLKPKHQHYVCLLFISNNTVNVDDPRTKFSVFVCVCLSNAHSLNYAQIVQMTTLETKVYLALRSNRVLYSTILQNMHRIHKVGILSAGLVDHKIHIKILLLLWNEISIKENQKYDQKYGSVLTWNVI